MAANLKTGPLELAAAFRGLMRLGGTGVARDVAIESHTLRPDYARAALLRLKGLGYVKVTRGNKFATTPAGLAWYAYETASTAEQQRLDRERSANPSNPAHDLVWRTPKKRERPLKSDISVYEVDTSKGPKSATIVRLTHGTYRGKWAMAIEGQTVVISTKKIAQQLAKDVFLGWSTLEGDSRIMDYLDRTSNPSKTKPKASMSRQPDGSYVVAFHEGPFAKRMVLVEDKRTAYKVIRDIANGQPLSSHPDVQAVLQ